LPVPLPFTDYGRAMAARRVMFDICSAMVDRVERDSVNDVESPTMLERFVRNSDKFSKDEITDNLLIFLFAGHDTSSCALTWILHYVQADPKFLQLLRAEVDATELRWNEAGKSSATLVKQQCQNSVTTV
jgi:cytochrome P450